MNVWGGELPIDGRRLVRKKGRRVVDMGREGVDNGAQIIYLLFFYI